MIAPAARPPTKAPPPQPRCPYQRTCSTGAADADPVIASGWPMGAAAAGDSVPADPLPSSTAAATKRNDFNIEFSWSCGGDDSSPQLIEQRSEVDELKFGQDGGVDRM